MSRMSRMILRRASLCLVACMTVSAQGQAAAGLGGSQADSGHAIAVDSSGNVFVSGVFRQTVDFDPGPGVTELSVGGSNAYFVASYTAQGALRYVIPIAGISTTLPETGLAVDDAGNVYVTGSFAGLVDFDPGVDEEILTSVGGRLFVASYDPTGAYRFAFNIGFGPPVYEAGKSIAISDDGNIYVTGTFSGTTDFDPDTDEFFLQANGISDMFVASYTSNGSFRFALAAGGTAADRGLDIAVDGSGNSFVTGAFRGTVDFDPSGGTFELTAPGTNENVFVASYTDGGALRYALPVTATGLGQSIGRGIDVDASGNAFVTGLFTGTADFDPGIDALELMASGGSDIFLTSYDGVGALRFAFRLGLMNPDEGRAVVVDASDTVFVTGNFWNGFDFDPGPGEYVISANTPDAFVARYDNAGNFLSADSVNPMITGNATINDVALDANGTPAIVGTYRGTLDLDLGVGTVLTTTNGSDDVFFTTLTTEMDTDGDGITDDNDNCTLIANPDQRNSNSDPFGNVCDPDLSNDGIVNVVDLGVLRTVFFTADADADFNGDGVVNVVDLGVMRTFFFLPPGPSGLQP